MLKNLKKSSIESVDMKTAEIVNDDEINVSEHNEYEEEIKDDEGNVLDIIKYHDCVLHKTTKYGKVKIEPVPPEEFLIERRAKSIEDANLTPFLSIRI